METAEDRAWAKFYGFWHFMVASSNEEIFKIKTYWLEPYKERIVKAWVDKHLHFGNVATSR